MPADEPPVMANLPALTFGCSRIGSVQTPLNQRQCVELIRLAYDLGIRHFDTANIYGQGDSERLLGITVQGVRSKVVLTTKGGQRLTPLQQIMLPFKAPLRWLLFRRRPNPAPQGMQSPSGPPSAQAAASSQPPSALQRAVAKQREAGVEFHFQPASITRSLASSLQRLQSSYVDTFLLHGPAPAVLDDEALWQQLKTLRQQGQCRTIGVSCDDLALASLAVEQPQLQCLQFAFDGSATSHAILRRAAERGIQAQVRVSWKDSDHVDGSLHATLLTLFAQPAVTQILMGTINAGHLQQNVSAFRAAEAAFQGNWHVR